VSIIEQLEAIRKRQGRDPMPDPRVIQGFGPGDAPPPSIIEQRLAEATPRESFEDDEPEPVSQTPVPTFSRPQVASPLIPTVPQTLDQVELMVVNEHATFRGRTCVMSERERAKIVAVVLQAISRSVREQLRELKAMRPRQRKRATVANQRRKKP